MKKISALLALVFLGALLCTACVTKKGNSSLDRDRNAAIDAAGRMNNAIGN
jgi:hypothetical protein